MSNLIIFGSSSHAKVVYWEAIKLKKFKVLGFVDDKKKKGEIIINYKKKNIYNLGPAKEIILDLEKNNIFFWGITGIGSNKIRKKIFKTVTKIKKDFNWAKVISSSAKVDTDVFIDEGSFISSGVVIKNGTKINKHCLINTSSSVDHDNIFSDYSSCGPGTITGGNVQIGELSHIGIGSVIKENVKIDSNVMIGGNSFVNKDCKKNNLYFGSPAKIVKNLNN
jgi:sugar O-acyltransferase (sialic acid O-acetyltransferase NeuD family)